MFGVLIDSVLLGLVVYVPIVSLVTLWECL